MRRSTVVYRVVLEYDEHRMDEYEAQNIALEDFPEHFGIGFQNVWVHLVERTAGGVDRDGVPNQERA